MLQNLQRRLSNSRRPRPTAESESESAALDRDSSRNSSRIRAYSKYDYPAANDPLGDTGHDTQSSSVSSPIPSEITIKLDDLHGHGGCAFKPTSNIPVAAVSDWRLFRKAPPPALDNCPQRPRGIIEGNEDEGADDEQATCPESKHDDTNNDERPNKAHTNDSAAAMAENRSTGSSSFSAKKSSSDVLRAPERPRSAPPSYDECVQLGLFEKERRTTTTTTTTTKPPPEPDTGNNIQTETTRKTTTCDELAIVMPRGVYESMSVPMEDGALTTTAARGSAQTANNNHDLLSYGFHDDDDDDDEEDADVRVRVDKLQLQRRECARRSTTTTTATTTTTTTAAAALSIQSAPPPSTGPAPTRLVHQDSLLSTSRSMASEESVREEMKRILAALQQQQGDSDEQQPQGQQPIHVSAQTQTPNSTSSRLSSSSSSSPPSSSSSSSSPPTSAKRPVYLDVPMGTSLYPQLGQP